MRPIKFKYYNKMLLKPERMEDCGSLPVHTDGKSCVSCWRLGFFERIRALVFGRIWLTVYGGVTQPPVSMNCRKKLFRKKRRKHGNEKRM